METNEIWEHWKPINNLSPKYNLNYVSDEISSNFRIILHDQSNKLNKIEVLFEHSVNNYRITYLEFKTDTLFYLNENYGIEFYQKWTFFKVYNSKFIKWLISESLNVIDDEDYNHYCIITPELIIDISVFYEPKILVKESNDII